MSDEPFVPADIGYARAAVTLDTYVLMACSHLAEAGPITTAARMFGIRRSLTTQFTAPEAATAAAELLAIAVVRLAWHETTTAEIMQVRRPWWARLLRRG